jgi:radical SAM superfamily enzyme YgiQ (UPF0313 family)
MGLTRRRGATKLAEEARLTRVLLVNPPSPEHLGAPLLGPQYVAASLLAAGHDVRVIDAAARHAHPDADAIVAEVDAHGPDLVGFGLFTRWVWHAYRLAARLRGRVPLLVAGGAHTTVRPDEVLAQGFDIAVVGEAEHVLVEIADRLGRGETVAGVVHGEMVADLDVLPFPQRSQHLFDPRWYDAAGRDVIPGGILTSRGCPARCTFCANYVTGRTFRYRSAANWSRS